MKTKKVIWGLLIALITLSCSTDDSELNNPVSKNSSKKSSFYGNSEIITEDYGMPFDDQYLFETRLIKIIYHVDNRDAKLDIRRKYARKYSDLFLVKVSTQRDPVEYWFLNLEDTNNTGAAPQPIVEEDEDVNNEQALYQSLLEDIKSNRYIDLYE